MGQSCAPSFFESGDTSKDVLPSQKSEKNVHLKVIDPLLKMAPKLLPDPHKNKRREAKEGKKKFD